jgi:hypothetical protein
VEISDTQMKDLEDRCLARHDWHGGWNYTLLAVPRPAPEPEPAAPPGPDLHALTDPATTSIPREDFRAAAAALEIPWAAAREQRLHLARGGPRKHNGGTPGPVKLSLPACLLAAVYRYRLRRTCADIAALLGVDQGHISVITRQIAALPQAAALLTPSQPPLHQMTR